MSACMLVAARCVPWLICQCSAGGLDAHAVTEFCYAICCFGVPSLFLEAQMPTTTAKDPANNDRFFLLQGP